MKIRKAIPFLLLLISLSPCPAKGAGQEQPTTYVIKRGDTLWGLSERFIKDPFYWPDMWSKNAEITNPHVIYPGQRVRVFPDRLELEPRQPVAAPESAGPAPLPEVAEERAYSVRGNEGRLLEQGITPHGTIIGAHNDRVITGMDDIVYTDLGTQQGVRGGEKYTVYSDAGPISHPFTNEIMGSKIIPLGTVQLTDVERKSSRAIITSTYKEISPGAYLLPQESAPPHEIPLRMTTRNLKGFIIDSQSGAQGIAAGDIAFIDLGSSQGAEVGNMLYIVRDVALDMSLTQGRIERLPQELLGALVILETGKKTATALVVKSIDVIYIGDKLVSQTR